MSRQGQPALLQSSVQHLVLELKNCWCYMQLLVATSCHLLVDQVRD